MTFAIFSRSSFSIMAPVGLFGYVSSTSFVFGVIAASNSSGVSLNSFSAFKSIVTGTAPARMAHGLYETKHGSGMIISSPGSSMVLMQPSIASDPPTVIST